MVIERMYCLNSSIVKKPKDGQEPVAPLFSERDRIAAEFITRVDNVGLTDEQAAKIKAIHERHAEEINAVLGW